jgi:hypothetical protein
MARQTRLPVRCVCGKRWRRSNRRPNCGGRPVQLQSIGGAACWRQRQRALRASQSARVGMRSLPLRGRMQAPRRRCMPCWPRLIWRRAMRQGLRSSSALRSACCLAQRLLPGGRLVRRHGCRWAGSATLRLISKKLHADASRSATQHPDAALQSMPPAPGMPPVGATRRDAYWPRSKPALKRRATTMLSALRKCCEPRFLSKRATLARLVPICSPPASMLWLRGPWTPISLLRRHLHCLLID